MIAVLKDCYREGMTRALILLAAVGVLAGCGGGSSGPSAERTVVTGFYPLAWAVRQVASQDTEVVNLTPAGAEPHDLELTPRDVTAIRDADLVVFVSGGFQPAVEEAVAERDGSSLEVLDGLSDPHVWLDPSRFAEVVREIGAALGRPAAAAALADRLLALDSELRRGLAACDRHSIVTTHSAFGRFAARYGLTEIPLTGRSPEAEPTPRQLQRIVERVRRSGATTVFTEPLVSDRLARTVAREADVEVAVLDPLEGLSEERLAAGEDYLTVMRSNLSVLREALGCR